MEGLFSIALCHFAIPMIQPLKCKGYSGLHNPMHLDPSTVYQPRIEARVSELRAASICTTVSKDLAVLEKSNYRLISFFTSLF